MNPKNIFWYDLAVGVPAFILAAYLGANIAISLTAGFVAASILNLLGVNALMTWQPSASFIRQRCNQCSKYPAEYCKATDEYLCEPCFEFAVEMVEEEDART